MKSSLNKDLKQFATENWKKSQWTFFSTLFIILIFQVAIFIKGNGVFSIFLCLVLGLLNVRMFVIYHDYVHGAFLKKSKTAKIFFAIFGIYMLSPLTIWKRTHNFHHAKNSELETHSYGSYKILTLHEFSSLNQNEKLIYLFQRHPVVIVCGHFFMFLYNFCILAFVTNFKKHWDSFFAFLIYTSIVLFCVSTKQWGHLALYVTPLFISHGLGSVLFYLQHNFPDAQYEKKASWTLESSALCSSSFLKMNGLMRWFTANIGYHHIHHLNSMIPFYNLPMAHESTVLQTKKRSISFNITLVLKSFRLKVYDDSKRKLVEL